MAHTTIRRIDVFFQREDDKSVSRNSQDRHHSTTDSLPLSARKKNLVPSVRPLPALQLALLEPAALVQPFEEDKPVPFDAGAGKFAVGIMVAQPQQARHLTFGEPLDLEVVRRDSADPFVEYYSQPNVLSGRASQNQFTCALGERSGRPPPCERYHSGCSPNGRQMAYDLRPLR